MQTRGPTTASRPAPAPAQFLGAVEAASLEQDHVLARLASSRRGLTDAEAAQRLAATGPNAVRSHRARRLVVLGRQLRSPLLLLLAFTAVASYFVGERSDALIIGVILAASVGLGFVNEYRAAKDQRNKSPSADCRSARPSRSLWPKAGIS